MKREPPLTRNNATGETSAMAAMVASHRAPGLRTRILAFLADGPHTPEEVQERLAREGTPTLLTTVRSRVCDARRDGLVTDAGTRGLGESGRAPVIRWRLTSRQEYGRFLAERRPPGGRPARGSSAFATAMAGDLCAKSVGHLATYCTMAAQDDALQRYPGSTPQDYAEALIIARDRLLAVSMTRTGGDA